MSNQASWNPSWWGEVSPSGNARSRFSTPDVSDVRQYFFRTDAQGRVFVLASMKDKPLVALNEQDSNAVLRRAWRNDDGQQALRDAGYAGDTEPTWTAGRAPARIEDAPASPTTEGPTPEGTAPGSFVTWMQEGGVTVAQVQAMSQAAQAIISAADPRAAYQQAIQNIENTVGQDQTIAEDQQDIEATKQSAILNSAIFLTHQRGLGGDAGRLNTASIQDFDTFKNSVEFSAISGVQPAGGAPQAPPPTDEAMRAEYINYIQGLVSNPTTENKTALATILTSVRGSTVSPDDVNMLLTGNESLVCMGAGISAECLQRLRRIGTLSDDDFIGVFDEMATNMDRTQVTSAVDRLARQRYAAAHPRSQIATNEREAPVPTEPPPAAAAAPAPAAAEGSNPFLNAFMSRLGPNGLNGIIDMIIGWVANIFPGIRSIIPAAGQQTADAGGADRPQTPAAAGADSIQPGGDRLEAASDGLNRNYAAAAPPQAAPVPGAAPAPTANS
jgi:hypothetical protein